MKKKVDNKVEIDPACEGFQITIRTDRESETVEKIVYAIEQSMLGQYLSCSVSSSQMQ